MDVSSPSPQDNQGGKVDAGEEGTSGAKVSFYLGDDQIINRSVCTCTWNSTTELDEETDLSVIVIFYSGIGEMFGIQVLPVMKLTIWNIHGILSGGGGGGALTYAGVHMREQWLWNILQTYVTQHELMRLFEGDIKTDILNSMYCSIYKEHFDTKTIFISYSYQKL